MARVTTGPGVHGATQLGRRGCRELEFTLWDYVSHRARRRRMRTTGRAWPSGAMLRRKPTRLELKLDDIEEFESMKKELEVGESSETRP